MNHVITNEHMCRSGQNDYEVSNGSPPERHDVEGLKCLKCY